NRSMWRNFPMIRSKRWVKANMVLLGDAKATAHFSIGSGTKLAMEDAIALADAMNRAPTVDAALLQYEEGRREEVEKTQHAADVSLVWFEHVDRFWDFDPVQFAFGVMTRAKAITYDNLTLRAPDFVREVDKAFAKQFCAKGFNVDVEHLVADCRFRPRQFCSEDLPAAWPRRPQGRHQADVGWHGPSVGRGRLGCFVGIADSLLPRQPGAARDGPRRNGGGKGSIRCRGGARRTLRL